MQVIERFINDYTGTTSGMPIEQALELFWRYLINGKNDADEYLCNISTTPQIAKISTIETLEHELAHCKENRSYCCQNDDYYEGWIESLKYAIIILKNNL